MMLIRWFFHWQVVAADVIVMPRSCSCTILHQTVSKTVEVTEASRLGQQRHLPVHGGRALVHFADLVGLASVIQDALGGRGLRKVAAMRILSRKIQAIQCWCHFQHCREILEIKRESENRTCLSSIDVGHDANVAILV